jgi:excisionase family DNA binding protein
LCIGLKILIIYTIVQFVIDNSKGIENMLDDKWININEAAEYLGVKVATIRSWIKKKNGIPAHKVGKFWKFKCSELDEWIKSDRGAGK